ncbi:hypothetical protein H9P43_005213 [Blastocladiella emersonii ATCC 22665]|nr:hypothetical protein H9P43_005213 [Blastocladiella emersonii ATCC 22665]
MPTHQRSALKPPPRAPLIDMADLEWIDWLLLATPVLVLTVGIAFLARDRWFARTNPVATPAMVHPVPYVAVAAAVPPAREDVVDHHDQAPPAAADAVDEDAAAQDAEPDREPEADTTARARLEQVRAEHTAAALRHRPAAAAAAGGAAGDPQLPKRLGKKRAANLERKENMRRYREWAVHNQQERERRREALDEERARIADERERAMRREEIDREYARAVAEKARRREEERRELEEAAKPSVYDMEERVMAYIQGHLVVHLPAMAAALNVRYEELEVYLEDKLDEGEWNGHLDLELGQFVYLDPARVAVLNAQLLAHGKVAKAESMRILLDPAARPEPAVVSSA